ncbi:MAG: hypothetical protein U0235_33130 [Polyangiaceae bacterium]
MFGETFSREELSALADGEGAGSDVLARLVSNELLMLGARGKLDQEYQFRHGLLRDAAYAMLEDDDRRALHLAAAELLARRGDAEALVTAEHFERGGAPHRAVEFFRIAAEQALNTLNLDHAGAIAQRGLACGAAGAERGSLLVVQANIAFIRGDPCTSLPLSKEAFALLPRESSAFFPAAAFTLAAGALVGDMELAPQVIEAILTAEPLTPTGYFGSAVGQAAEILEGIGQYEAAEQLLCSAEARATEDAPASFRAHVAYARAGRQVAADDGLGTILAAVSPGLELAESSGDPLASVLFNFGAGVSYAEVGAFDLARRCLGRFEGQFSRAVIFHAWRAIHLGWCDVLQGSFAEARAHADRAMADPRHALALHAYAALHEGDLRDARRAIDQALEGIERTHVTPFVVALGNAIAAAIARAEGRLETARSLAARAAEHTRGPPSARSLIDRVHLEILLATGEDVSAVLSRAAARIERHRRSLPAEFARSYVALPDNARILALAGGARY